MEKSEIIIDLVEHPERYSDQQMQQILDDKESMQLYDAMLDARMAVDRDEAKRVDVDGAWYKFAAQNAELLERHSAKRQKAVGYGWRKMVAMFAGAVAISGIAFAAIHVYNSNRPQEHAAADVHKTPARNVASGAQAAAADTMTVTARPKAAVRKTFENVTLADMLGEIAAYYGMQVEFRNTEARRLRYYYEWDSSRGIDAVIGELNHSEQMSVKADGKDIVVE